MWNAMIAGYSQYGMGKPFSSALICNKTNHCTRLCDIHVPPAGTCKYGFFGIEGGEQLNAGIEEPGLQADVVVANSLVNMYVEFGSLEDAQGVFDRLRRKNVVTWTSLIVSGHGHEALCLYSGDVDCSVSWIFPERHGSEALSVYGDMQQEGIAAPDSVTFLCLLQACASGSISALDKGSSSMHRLVERGLLADVFVASSLVNMYATCGSLEDAQNVFDTLGQRDVMTWNAMIAGYSQQGKGQEALRLYIAIRQEGFTAPDPVTIVCLLQAYASMGTSALENGIQLHEHRFENKDFKGMGHEAIHLYTAMQEGGSFAPPGGSTNRLKPLLWHDCRSCRHA